MAPLRILVTGASSFVARAFLKKLDDPALSVYALDRHPDPDAPSFLKDFFVRDITKPFQLEGAFDFIFHLAALNVTHVGKAEYSAYHDVNVNGTRNLLRAVEIRNFVFMSTAKVYDPQQENADECGKINPQGDYEKSKLEAEAVCRENFKGKLTVLRPVNIVGATQAEKALLPVFFKRACENLPLDIFVPRGTRVQMLDVEDVVEAFLLLMKKKAPEGAFNLASPDDISVETLAQEIIRLTGSRSKVSLTGQGEARFCKILSGKAEKDLGWKPRFSIPEILQRYNEQFKASRT